MKFVVQLLVLNCILESDFCIFSLLFMIIISIWWISRWYKRKQSKKTTLSWLHLIIKYSEQYILINVLFKVYLSVLIENRNLLKRKHDVLCEYINSGALLSAFSWLHLSFNTDVVYIVSFKDYVNCIFL
jgi:hypothetical protein